MNKECICNKESGQICILYSGQVDKKQNYASCERVFFVQQTFCKPP